jgi:hypothetical protein
MLELDDIVCYVPVYNDAEALERNLTYLDKIGIKALVIDGRFTDFPQINDNDVSTDETFEVATKHGAHYVMAHPMREQEKFNLALEIARERGHEVFMYCGADTYYEADVNEFMINLQRFYEQYVTTPTQLMVFTEELQPDSKWNNTGTRQPRIILNYWKMEARHLHWTMYEKGAPDTQPLSPITELVDGIKLYHDNSIRPKERDDMMTDYQNHNVPRERMEFMDKVVPKAYDHIHIFPWRLGIDGTYEEGRREFLKSTHNTFAHSKQFLDDKGLKPKDFGASEDFKDTITESKEEYSHMIVIDEGYGLDFEHKHLFENILEERNNLMQQLPLISAVWTSPEQKGHFTLNPDGKITMNWPKFPKVEQLYSPKGLKLELEPILVAPYTRGPVVCLSRKVVALVEHMGDKLDFLAVLMGLGIQMHADARIQYEWKD